jgi:hypothetical protein
MVKRSNYVRPDTGLPPEDWSQRSGKKKPGDKKKRGQHEILVDWELRLEEIRGEPRCTLRRTPREGMNIYESHHPKVINIILSGDFSRTGALTEDDRKILTSEDRTLLRIQESPTKLLFTVQPSKLDEFFPEEHGKRHASPAVAALLEKCQIGEGVIGMCKPYSPANDAQEKQASQQALLSLGWRQPSVAR